MKNIEKALRLIAGVRMPLPPSFKDLGAEPFRERNDDEGSYEYLDKQNYALKKAACKYIADILQTRAPDL